MKYVPLFEEFINEANEEVLAQGACKNAMFMAQKEVDKFLKKVENLGFIQNPSTKVKPFNTGYELLIKFKQDWREVQALSPEDQKRGSLLFGLTDSIWLQPSTFFESNLEEGRIAYIEGRTLNYERDMAYDEKYPKYKIESKKDIKTVHKQFADVIMGQLERVSKQMGL